MGGLLSGGGRGAPKTSDFTKIDIAEYRKFGALRPGASGATTWKRNGEPFATIGWSCVSDHIAGDRLRLRYRYRPYGAEWEEIDDAIPLTRTFPNYGGVRLWFVCPGCGQRRRCLYGGRRYRCRECYGATYPSQYQERFERALYRAQDIRERLGADTDITWPIMERPRGMRRKTFARLKAAELRNRRIFNAGMMRKFGCLV